MADQAPPSGALGAAAHPASTSGRGTLAPVSAGRSASAPPLSAPPLSVLPDRSLEPVDVAASIGHAGDGPGTLVVVTFPLVDAKEVTTR